MSTKSAESSECLKRMDAIQPDMASLIAQRAQRMSLLRHNHVGELVKAAVKTSANGKDLATFEPKVLEHLRQSNFSAYETMLAQMKNDILKIIKKT